MNEKMQNIFKNKKTENLISFLIILIVTLIIINYILKEDKTEKQEDVRNTAVFAENYSVSKDNLSNNLENILKKINGVGNVSVLITYSESEVTKMPMYNENLVTNEVEETNSIGNRKTTTVSSEKEVIIGADDNPVIQSIQTPKIEGAVITAEGASDVNVKGNIIAAVEAATGLATHKIQVFEMNVNKY